MLALYNTLDIERDHQDILFVLLNWSNFSFSWQNTADLSDLVSSGRDRKPEEVAFAEECEVKSFVFRAERFVSYKLCHLICIQVVTELLDSHLSPFSIY